MTKQSHEPNEAIADPVEPLAAKERRALELHAEGHTDNEIANRMKMSQTTAALHLSNARRKLGCATKADAVQKGQELGIIVDAHSAKRPKMTPEEQGAEFERLSAQLGCDDDDEKFQGVLRKLGKQK